MFGLHNNQPLILHGRIVKGEETAIITSSKVFPEYYMIYVDQFEDVINEAIDEWVYFFKHGNNSGYFYISKYSVSGTEIGLSCHEG